MEQPLNVILVFCAWLIESIHALLTTPLGELTLWMILVGLFAVAISISTLILLLWIAFAIVYPALPKKLQQKIERTVA